MTSRSFNPLGVVGGAADSHARFPQGDLIWSSRIARTDTDKPRTFPVCPPRQSISGTRTDRTCPFRGCPVVRSGMQTVIASGSISYWRIQIVAPGPSQWSGISGGAPSPGSPEFSRNLKAVLRPGRGARGGSDAANEVWCSRAC